MTPGYCQHVRRYVAIQERRAEDGRGLPRKAGCLVLPQLWQRVYVGALGGSSLTTPASLRRCRLRPVYRQGAVAASSYPLWGSVAWQGAQSWARLKQALAAFGSSPKRMTRRDSGIQAGPFHRRSAKAHGVAHAWKLVARAGTSPSAQLLTRLIPGGGCS